MSKQLKIAFNVDSFSFRGTEESSFCYSHKNEILLNNKSIIVCPNKLDERNNLDVIMKFTNRFQVFIYDDYKHLVEILQREKVNGLYIIKSGDKNDLSNYFELNKINIPLLIHCVYHVNDPHGLVYCGVSEAVVKNSNYPFVPHIISLMEEAKTINLRKQLKIPENAIIYGRHGGKDTFSLNFTNPTLVETLLKVLDNNTNIYFAFMPRPFILENINHPRILYFDVNIDPVIKRSFINMCDAMIHACYLGESFGISVLEFSVMNKPVITWSQGTLQQHIKNLRDKAILYNNMEELYNILTTFKKENYINKDWNVALPQFSDINVMKKFDQVFLQPLIELYH
jgi:glycosyltransferase involved in cell wall biosynthesis